MLLKCSDGDEIDVGIICGFIDRIGIILVIFIAVAVAGNNMRGYQLHLIPKLAELATPVMCRATGFHVDLCLRMIADELSHLFRAYSSIYQCLTEFTIGLYWIYTNYSIEEIENCTPSTQGNAVDIAALAKQHKGLSLVPM